MPEYAEKSLSWNPGDPLPDLDEKVPQEPEWLSPFADIDTDPFDESLGGIQAGQSASEDKKKYFVVDAGEELTILCHAPNPSTPESALRDALREIEDLKLRLKMPGSEFSA